MDKKILKDVIYYLSGKQGFVAVMLPIKRKYIKII